MPDGFTAHDEIRPPRWVLDGARRLSTAEFGEEFIRLWDAIEHGLIKSECWQTYLEPETRSWREYQLGNYAAVQDLLEEEADLDQHVYDAVTKNGTPFVRVRLVSLPLSRYVTFEMWNYLVRARRGETVEVALAPPDDPRPLPNHTFFDFLLFDDRAALVHDYGLDGLQVGGWLVTSPPALARLAGTAERTRRRAVPFDTFVRRHGLTFPPR